MPPYEDSQRSFREGFSLVELLLFTAVVAIMAGSIVGFSLVSSNIASRTETIAEVEQSGQNALQRITRAIETADKIVFPAPGSVGEGVLLLEDVGGGNTKETYIHDYAGYIRMVERQDGDDEKISYLSTSDVQADHMLVLHNGYGTSTSATIAFYMQNKAVGTELASGQYGKAFRATATLRAAQTLPVESSCAPNCVGACETVADCTVSAPYCNSSCEWMVPTCANGSCGEVMTGPCPNCQWCGDGRIVEGENCDDACLFAGFPPGCDDGTTVNDINGGDGNDECTRACTVASCGDGVINTLDEECDDGNLTNGDGCDSNCMTEIACGDPGWTIDVAFVVDTSRDVGKGQQLNKIKASLNKFLEYMDFAAGDTAALVGFSTSATVHQALTNDEDAMHSAVNALDVGGWSNLEQGITLAKQELAAATGNKQIIILLDVSKPDRKGNNPIVSCSDFTSPTDGCDAIDAASQAKSAGIYIYSVGLGIGSSVEDMLKDIRTAPPDTLTDYYYYAPLVNDLLDVYLQISDDLCPCDDGVTNGSEQCDDGNDNNWDDCTNECTDYACGDGYVRIGFEQCDDGNTSSGDGCSSTCYFEPSYYCGSGTVEGTERCDDGGICVGGSTPGASCFKDPTNIADPDAACGGGTCTPQAGDGCDASCDVEEYTESYCSTENQVCLVDDDCMEPDGGTCAVCTDGLCTSNAGDTQCTDLVDNDGDGNIDCSDSDCISATDFGSFTVPVSTGVPSSSDAVDLDGDGDIDIVTGTTKVFSNTQIFWYENDGASPPDLTTEHQVTPTDWGANSVISVDTVDLDKDGDIDVLSSGAGNLYWHSNNGSESFTDNLISGAEGQNERVYAIDLNQDGETDVFNVSEFLDTVNWWDNDGSETFGTKRTIASGLTGLEDAIPVKIDGDANIDVVAVYGSTVSWFKSDGASPPAFTKQSPDLDTTLTNGKSIYATDLDGDGDNDVIVGDSAGVVRWYRNDGAGGFTASDVDTTLGGSSVVESVYAGKIDGDSDVDIIVTYEYPVLQGGLNWYANDGGSPPSFGSAKVISSVDNNYVTLADITGNGSLEVVASETAQNVWYNYVGAGQCNTEWDDEGSIPVSCCANDIQNTLTVTLTGDGAGCACADAATVTLSWNGSIWQGNATVCGKEWQVDLAECSGGSPTLFEISGAGSCSIPASYVDMGAVCDPFSLTYGAINLGADCCTSAGVADFNVTP